MGRLTVLPNEEELLLTFLIWGLAIVDHWPKNNKNRVQTFAGGAIWANVREK